MKIESETQTVEVIPKRKGHGGRPKKDPDEKREPALMLRLNVSEQKRLQQLIKEHGWSGDPSSFVRDLILSDKSQARGVGIDAVSLEHSMSLLNSVLDDLEDTMTEEQRDFVGQIRSVMNKAAQAIYNSK